MVDMLPAQFRTNLHSEVLKSLTLFMPSPISEQGVPMPRNARAQRKYLGSRLSAVFGRARRRLICHVRRRLHRPSMGPAPAPEKPKRARGRRSRQERRAVQGSASHCRVCRPPRRRRGGGRRAGSELRRHSVRKGEPGWEARGFGRQNGKLARAFTCQRQPADGNVSRGA